MLIVCCVISRLSNAEIPPPIQPPSNYPLPFESFGQAAVFPSSKELSEEKLHESRQVDLAIEKLRSRDEHTRIVATETLNAYRIPKSEQTLKNILLFDRSAAVRQTAAQSLYFFHDLSEQTLKALIKAFQDKDMQTGRESLNTVIRYTLRHSGNQDKFRKIMSKLQKAAHSRFRYQDIHNQLDAFIKDQSQ